jgi:hypothetical protein
LISHPIIVATCFAYPAKPAYERDQARHANNDAHRSGHGAVLNTRTRPFNAAQLSSASAKAALIDA